MQCFAQLRACAILALFACLAGLGQPASGDVIDDRIRVGFENLWPTRVVIVDTRDRSLPGTPIGVGRHVRNRSLYLDPDVLYELYPERNPYLNLGRDVTLPPEIGEPIRAFKTIAKSASTAGPEIDQDIAIPEFDIIGVNTSTKRMHFAIRRDRNPFWTLVGGLAPLQHQVFKSDVEHIGTVLYGVEEGAQLREGSTPLTCDTYVVKPGRNIFTYFDACQIVSGAVTQGGIEVDIVNRWPNPVVLAEVGAPVKGIALVRDRDHALQLKPNTDYAVYEGYNPAYALFLASRMPASPIKLTDNPPLMAFKTGGGKMRVPDIESRMLVVTNSAEETVVVSQVLPGAVPVTLRSVEPGHTEYLFASANVGYSLKPTLVNDESCEQQLSLQEGWNYLDYPAPELPCTMRGAVKLAVDGDLRYDQQSYLMAHNAAENHADGWRYAQQTYSIGELLREHGVRALELDLKYYSRAAFAVDLNANPQVIVPAIPEDFYVCHENCDASLALLPTRRLRPLASVLTEIRQFLDDNASEIVTVFIELTTERGEDIERRGDQLMSLLNNAGLFPYIYWPDSPYADFNDCIRTAQATYGAAAIPTANVSIGPSHDWPLVSSMVSTNRRLVLFINTGGMSSAACLPYTWRYLWENKYSNSGSLILRPAENGYLYGFEPDEQFVLLRSDILRDPTFLFQRSESFRSGINQRTLTRFNHFEFMTIGDQTADNSEKSILARILAWKLTNVVPSDGRGYGRGLPNFIAVDFVEAGQGSEVVAALNACWPKGERFWVACIRSRMQQLQRDETRMQAPGGISGN
ncbi:hypothetical protein [Dongia sedimenti]|uniref:Uncharacterized protein n=1 Tax=Dongia sedimenti TaxID=3064282 RepID=A0ABU0YVD6_9PROT|nr:hypothetical protein [Rhodospirillaceae bacterium R-7]